MQAATHEHHEATQTDALGMWFAVSVEVVGSRADCADCTR